MKTFHRKADILARIKEGCNLKSDTELAHFLGIAKTTLSNWRSRDSIDYNLVLSKCEHVDLNWLLTGEERPLVLPISDSQTKESLAFESKKGGIPLIPLEAFAGFGTDNNAQVMEYECETYIVPAFRDAEFLIPVKGDSMCPKYASGDLVACKKLPLDTFFQWNKVYVLNTIQGVLIKRIKRGADADHITIVSENKLYEPFELHKAAINSLAIVVGVIRLE